MAKNMYLIIFTGVMFTSMPFMVEGVPSITAGRRRRRSIFNMRICGPGQRAIWSEYKKKVLDCEPCGDGEYRSDLSHHNIMCNVCEAGRVTSLDKSYCIGDICKPGTHGVSSDTTCQLCEAGKYSADYGRFECTACESGRYNTGLSNHDCIGDMCPAGKWGTIGINTNDAMRRTCFKCSPGMWSTGGGATCKECQKGKYSGEGASMCITHDTCPRTMYYQINPVSTSNKIICTRCVYSSWITLSAFIFSCCVGVINLLLVLSDIKKYCWVMFFVISPAVWSLCLMVCRTAPNIVPSIISIVMNLFCFIPAGKLFMNYIGGVYKTAKENKVSKKITKEGQSNMNIRHHTVNIRAAV